MSFENSNLFRISIFEFRIFELQTLFGSGYAGLGRSSLLNRKVYATFNGREGSKSLPGLCLDLLSEQEEAWLDLRKGRESLKDVRERDIACRGFSVRLQHNPGRIKNSLADVSERNENERPCFLCLDHLPEEQKGILYRGEYMILCNPRPVFSSHFTLSHSAHRRQAIAETIDALLRFVTDFGSGWAVLYNGPRCGASSPDHLHFQAIPAGLMPIEKEIREEKRETLKTEVDGVLLYRMRDLGREVVVLEGDDPTAVASAFNRFLSALKRILLLAGEPMLNVAGFYEERKWRLVIFPRRKHRPDVFFMERDGRIVVSPGVIDMGGVLITPVERDFDGLDASAVEALYGEVSLEGQALKSLATIIPERSLLSIR